MKIVLDAMGSDNYPVPDVEGAVLAARDAGEDEEIILVGDRDRIEAELSKHAIDGLPLSVTHASTVIEMTDRPARAVRSRPDSSMVVGMDIVRSGAADAFVSAGNTGGALAAALFRLGRIRGIRRPGLATLFPLPTGPVVILDIGANADCRPEYLYQFALMGSAYAESAMEKTRPTVATLSNGEEPGKGSWLVRKAFELLQESPLNFIGNVEPKEFVAGEADVVVTDGFTGNVVVKTAEAVSKMLTTLLRDELMSSPLTAVGGLLAKPAFGRVKRQLDPFRVGGAVLLGVRGVVIVGHGRSNEVAIKNAIRQARVAVRGGLVAAIEQGLAAYDVKREGRS